MPEPGTAGDPETERAAMPQQEPGRGAALRRAQDDQQERAFTLWFNSASGCGLESVVTGLRSGTALIALLESLGAESLGRHNRAPTNEPQTAQPVSRSPCSNSTRNPKRSRGLVHG